MIASRFANTHLSVLTRITGAAEERNLPRLTLMVGWWSTDVTVGCIQRPTASLSNRVIFILSNLSRCLTQVPTTPEIPFPHAAMVLPPPGRTSWLQPLTSALSSLGPIAVGNGGAQNVKKKTKHKNKRLDASGTGMESTADVCGVDIAPNFVTPVWESCANVLDTSKSGRAIDESGNRRHLHLADAQLFASGEAGDGERSELLQAGRGVRLTTHLPPVNILVAYVIMHK